MRAVRIRSFPYASSSAVGTACESSAFASTGTKTIATSSHRDMGADT